VAATEGKVYSRPPIGLGKRIRGLARFQGVDQESEKFAEFYEAAKDDCLRAVLASVGDRQVAEDLVAEAFARAWASWRQVSRHPAPRAWVLRTALNARVSWWRRRWREVEFPPGEALRVAHDGGLGDPVDAALMAVVLRLPLRQRQVVALRLFLDLDTAHTSDVHASDTSGVPMTSDSKLMTSVKGSFANVHLRTPLEATLRRGQALRRRRRLGGAAGVAAVAGGRRWPGQCWCRAAPGTLDPRPR
jgi:DNA-directed RNA polymerase specialized sigma24 family protein